MYSNNEMKSSRDDSSLDFLSHLINLNKKGLFGYIKNNQVNYNICLNFFINNEEQACQHSLAFKKITNLLLKESHFDETTQCIIKISIKYHLVPSDALHKAVQRLNVSSVKILLEHGFNP